MNHEHLGPIIYDSLDRPNASNGAEQRASRQSEPVARRESVFSTTGFIVLISILSTLLIAVYMFVIWRLQALAVVAEGFQAYAATTLLWVFYLVPIGAFAIGALGGIWYAIMWWRHEAYRKRFISLHDGPHFDMFGARNVPYASMFGELAHRMYDVQQAYGNNSMYKNVQTLTKDDSWTYSPNMSRQESSTTLSGNENAPMLTDSAGEEVAPAELPTTLLGLRKAGMICRSGKSLTIGFNDLKQPVTLELDNNAAMAVAGRPRKGKTSTVRFMAAQVALLGGKIAIIDPHGNASDDSLLQSMLPLRQAFFTEPATKPNDGLKIIEAVFEEGLQRLERGKREEQYPLILVIDEFTAMMDGSNPAWEAVSKRIREVLPSTIRQMCKVGINLIIIGHSWQAKLAGGTSLRDNISTKLFHQSAPSSASLFKLPTELAKGLDSLKVGQALKYENGEAEFVSYIPHVTTEDLQSIVPFIPIVVDVERDATFLEDLLVHELIPQYE